MRAVLKPRLVFVVVLALLAALGLTACRTNVGYAATIDGTRYSESDIGDYLTPEAQPVRRQGTDGSQSDYPVRAFVVETLIGDKLLAKVVTKLPGGAPSAAVQTQLRTQVLQGASPQKALAAAGIRGFSGKFQDLLVHRVVLAQYLQSAAQQGAPVQQLVESVPFSVSVNPRYGVWNAKTRAFDGADGAGAPSFLKLPATLSPLANAVNGGVSPGPSTAP